MRSYRKIAIVLALLFCIMVIIAGCATVNEDTTNAITLEAVSVILNITASAAIAMIGVVGTWLATKIGKNKSLTNISEAVRQVIQAAQLTVGELQQTTVSALKAVAEDGKLTEAQIATLKSRLLQETKKKLTAPVVQLLEASQMDITALIQGAAEDMIYNMKPIEAYYPEELILT